jgi:hypothetical protein
VVENDTPLSLCMIFKAYTPETVLTCRSNACDVCRYDKIIDLIIPGFCPAFLPGKLGLDHGERGRGALEECELLEAAYFQPREKIPVSLLAKRAGENESSASRERGQRSTLAIHGHWGGAERVRSFRHPRHTLVPASHSSL